MQFRGFELDRFQVEAIDYLNKGYSVVVSAATGTGKTVIADYVIDTSGSLGETRRRTEAVVRRLRERFGLAG